MSTRESLIAFVCLFAGSIGPAMAITVAPGDNVVLTGTASGSDPSLAGPVIVNATTSWFQPLISLSALPPTGAGGRVNDRVILSSDLGTTIFGPRFSLDYNSSDFQDFWIAGYELTGYAGWSTDIAYRLEDGGTAPSHVDRSADGDSLLFHLASAGPAMSLGPLTSATNLWTAFPSILTNAEGYINTGTLRIIGFRTTDPEFATSILIQGISAPYYKEMPSAVPLPASVWGLGAALAGLFAMARRRRT